MKNRRKIYQFSSKLFKKLNVFREKVASQVEKSKRTLLKIKIETVTGKCPFFLKHLICDLLTQQYCQLRIPMPLSKKMHLLKAGKYGYLSMLALMQFALIISIFSPISVNEFFQRKTQN